MFLDNQLMRCVFCGANSLDIYSNNPTCTECNHKFASFEGIIFLGRYCIHDTLGLLEVVSKISSTLDPKKTRISLETTEERLRQAYQKTYVDQQKIPSNNKATPGSNEMALAVRLREWASFELLSKGFDFKNKICLDIGAGFGSDSCRLVNRGATVVCVDYNPISLKNGALIVPEAQWLGGNAECLPFESNTFDFTIANATLHHMHKQHESVKEMHRVTKPGGYIFLISDPFTHNANNQRDFELNELNVFDNHPMVMNGVNEGLIPLNQYFEILRSIDRQAKILTMKIHDNIESANSPTYWPLNKKTEEYLGKRSGNISSVLKVSDRNFQPPVVQSEEIPAELLFKTIGNPGKSIHFLLPYLQSFFFDDFPFKECSKFHLMNGWNAKQTYRTNWRRGYNRVRLFCTKLYLSKIKAILIKKRTEDSQHDTKMYLFVNGMRKSLFTLHGNSITYININLKDSCWTERNVIELGIAGKGENKGAKWGPYDPSKSFYVNVNWKKRKSVFSSRIRNIFG